MEFSSANIAVAVSLISNCIAIIFLIFMLFRILSETNNGHRLVREGSDKLIRAGEELTAVVNAADAMILRMRGAAAAEGGSRASSGGSLVISPEGIKILSRLMQSLSQHTFKEMDSILLEMRHLLGSLKRLPPGGFSAWQEQNQATIDRILEIQGIAPEVMLSIKANIEDSKIVTQELERASKQVEGQNLGTEELNTYLQQQEKLIEQMRERATRAEERSEMLDQQIRALSEVDQSRKSDSQELDRLRNQNAQLSQERSSLVRHLETLTSEIKRTKLEKDFVEDRLLSMVEETDAPRSVPSSA
jgi:hypothetical protein